MGQFQGWADAPTTGAYDEQEVAGVVRQAVENSLWLPFFKRLDIKSGNTVTIPIRGRLAEPSSSALNESISIPLDKLSISAKTLALQERGRGVQVSRIAMNRSPIDLLSEHKMAIAEQMRLDMDTILGTAAQGSQLKYAANGVASYALGTAGSFTAAAISNLNFFHVRKMRDLAFRTYLMPKRSGGKFALVCSTAGVRGILDDPEFLEINKGSNPGIFEKTLAGTIADVEVHEENHALADNVGTNSDVGEGVFIADEAFYYAVLEMPSIHYDSTIDMGRFTNIAWYGDYAAGTSTDLATAGLVRSIHFGSS